MIKSDFIFHLNDYWFNQGNLILNYEVKNVETKEVLNTCKVYKNIDIDTTKSEVFELLISNFDAKEFDLPKTNEIHDITKKIYEDLCSSSTMIIFITDKDEKEVYDLNLHPEYIEQFVEDIKKFNLEDAVEYNEDKNTFIVYQNFCEKFNDAYELPFELEIEGFNKLLTLIVSGTDEEFKTTGIYYDEDDENYYVLEDNELISLSVNELKDIYLLDESKYSNLYVKNDDVLFEEFLMMEGINSENEKQLKAIIHNSNSLQGTSKRMFNQYLKEKNKLTLEKTDAMKSVITKSERMTENVKER